MSGEKSSAILTSEKLTLRYSTAPLQSSPDAAGSPSVAGEASSAAAAVEERQSVKKLGGQRATTEKIEIAVSNADRFRIYV